MDEGPPRPLTLQEVEAAARRRRAAARDALICELAARSRGRPWRFVLFGPLARGDFHGGSDADIVVLDAGEDWRAAERAALDAAAAAAVPADISFYEDLSKAKAEVQRDGWSVADPRWLLLRREVEDAASNLAAGVDLHDHELQDAEAAPRLRRQREKAFQKFLQDGYGSLEKALIRVLELFDEPVPRGGSWRADLVSLATAPGCALGVGDPAGRGLARRPPFAPGMVADIERLRRFRHIVMHGYAAFDLAQARPAVEAARRVAADLPAAAEAFGAAAGLLGPPAAKPD
jgi:predicted nucleotidyltransferase